MTPEDIPVLLPGQGEDSQLVGFPRVLERVCLCASTRTKDDLKEPRNFADITVYSLRYTFAAVAAQKGLSELTIAELLGIHDQQIKKVGVADV
jgi:hypothetical protein